MPGGIFWNGCIENFHCPLQRCDWLEQLREYAASNQQLTEKFCFIHLKWRELHVLLANALANQIAVKQSLNFLCNHSQICKFAICKLLESKLEIFYATIPKYAISVTLFNINMYSISCFRDFCDNLAYVWMYISQYLHRKFPLCSPAM